MFLLIFVSFIVYWFLLSSIVRIRAHELHYHILVDEANHHVANRHSFNSKCYGIISHTTIINGYF